LTTSLTVLLGVGWFVLLVAIDFAVMAWLYRIRRGTFTLLRDDDKYFSFKTDLGHFTVNRERHVLRVTRDGQSEELPLDRLDHLDVGYARR